MANIAGGFDAGSNRGFVNFLNYAYRSASEVQSLLYVALDQKYIEQHIFEANYSDAERTKKLIGGLIKYLETSERKS